MEIKITRAEYPDLPQLYEMLWRSFESHFLNDPKDCFKPYVEKCPSYRDDSFFIAKYRDRIVAAVQVILLNVYVEGKKLLLGGIGQVGTHPDFRGKGLAGLLLKETIKYMKKLDVAYSLLFAGPVPLYKKYGWREIQIKKIDAKVGRKKLNWSLKNYTVKQYAPSFRYDLFFIHEQFIKKYNSCVIRNPIYWDTYYWQFKARDTATYMLQTNTKKSMAYLTVKQEKEKLSIFEYGSLDEKNQDYFKMLLAYVIKKYKAAEICISYVNKNYVPLIVLENEFNAQTQNVTGFMVQNIKKAINWSRAEKNTLFFEVICFNDKFLNSGKKIKVSIL